mmetsp:Transcript_90442/g.174093  ORF Transcript_90442/g.174093 Transcript_90442/m.174093 type:complete len:110 (+) Transcript_90442:1100-1429(+)
MASLGFGKEKAHVRGRIVACFVQQFSMVHNTSPVIFVGPSPFCFVFVFARSNKPALCRARAREWKKKGKEKKSREKKHREKEKTREERGKRQRKERQPHSKLSSQRRRG